MVYDIITNNIGYITNYIANYEVIMLKPLLGSENAERVLIFLHARYEGYATEIARFFETNLFGIQNQLDRLEAGGVLVNRTAGRTRIYSFNPAYPFLNELIILLEKALKFYPEETREKLLMNRRRPRRRGKPL
jgi:hypothetical protein